MISGLRNAQQNIKNVRVSFSFVDYSVLIWRSLIRFWKWKFMIFTIFVEDRFFLFEVGNPIVSFVPRLLQWNRLWIWSKFWERGFFFQNHQWLLVFGSEMQSAFVDEPSRTYLALSAPTFSTNWEDKAKS